MMESEQTAELAAALAKAQSVMGPAIINRVNPHFKNRYADLAAVYDAIRKPLSDHGLSLTHQNQIRDGVLIVLTKLRLGDQWIASEFPAGAASESPQKLGSGITYARRYNAASLVAIAADEDDDGEATRKANGQHQPAPETGELISDEQIQTLRSALKVRDLDETEWKKRASKAIKKPIEDLGDIPASAFQRCLNDVRNAGAPQ